MCAYAHYYCENGVAAVFGGKMKFQYIVQTLIICVIACSCNIKYQATPKTVDYFILCTFLDNS